MDERPLTSRERELHEVAERLRRANRRLQDRLKPIEEAVAAERGHGLRMLTRVREQIAELDRVLAGMQDEVRAAQESADARPERS